MKIDFYDLFSLHTPSDFPEAGGENYITAAVKNRVMRNISAKSAPIRSRRIVKTVIAAAAVAACMGITVGAVSGRFGQFFSTLSRSEIYNSDTNHGYLPAIGESTVDMSEYYDFPEANFETDGSVSAELLGVYGDSSTLMLSIMITPQNGVDISDMDMPFYFKLKKPDGSEKFLFQSGMGDIEKFTPADVEGAYCLTFYLTEPNIAGGRLLIESDGIYTKEQTTAAFKKIREYQERLRVADEKKKGWSDDEVQESYMMERAFYKDVAPEAAGAVSAEIEIPPLRTEPIELNAYGISARLDSLSLYVSDVPDDYKSDRYAGTAHTIYLKDGSIISDQSPGYSFPDTEIDLSKFSEYPYIRGTNVKDGRICCFNRPISIDEIEKISVGVINYDDDNNEQMTEYIIYGE